MTTQFLKSGNTYRVSSTAAMDLHDHLPAAVFVVKKSMEGYYLEGMEDFVLPSKVYGSHTKDAQRVLSTFEARDGGTGLLLCGAQGMDKHSEICSVAGPPAFHATTMSYKEEEVSNWAKRELGKEMHDALFALLQDYEGTGRIMSDAVRRVLKASPWGKSV